VIALDTSALVAMARSEPEHAAFAEAIAENRCLMGLPTALETHIVLRNQLGAEGMDFLREFLQEPNVNVIDFSQALFIAACRAFDRYGKGRHAAGLNFGDCMAYAVAKANDVPLLFKGNDFSQTDIRPAVP
jgi:ribonuclease VapC